ncbi:MAG TPA: lysozyme inhibitor LprI family protein [Allosphingosinicella sp.]
MKRFPLLAVVLTVAAVAAEPTWDWGEARDEWASSPEYESSKALCRRVRDREPPASDRPDSATAESLKGCSSEALYFGIGRPADPVRARQCAFLEAETEEGSPFAGRSMLMTIYANGRGARRDLDVAIHLACGLEGAPMESHGRVTRLAELKAKGWKGDDFHYCDDITSGLAMGHCADHGATIEGAKREAELARLSASWTAAEKQALARLRQAHEAFADAHSSGEIDLSGTARGALAIAAEEALRDELLGLVRELSAGRAPRYDAGAHRLADSRLNAAYRGLMRATAPAEWPGAVTREGIRDAQRAWLRYRDAALAFAAVKFPKASRDSLAAWLTEKRTRMLSAEE